MRFKTVCMQAKNHSGWKKHQVLDLGYTKSEALTQCFKETFITVLNILKDFNHKTDFIKEGGFRKSLIPLLISSLAPHCHHSALLAMLNICCVMGFVPGLFFTTMYSVTWFTDIPMNCFHSITETRSCTAVCASWIHHQ